MTDYDKVLKILLFGDKDVGKTQIMFKFSDDTIKTNLISTIGIDYKSNIIEYQGKKIKLQMWNCTVEKLGTISTSFHRGAHGILLVYDPNNRESFKNIQKWLRNIDDHASDDVVRMLIGNKTNNSCETSNKTCPRDATCTNIYCYPTIITDRVTPEQAEKFANEHGMKFIETFADENNNIDLAMMMLVRDILAKQNGNLGSSQVPKTNKETPATRSRCTIC